MGTHREYKQEVRDALYGFVYLNRAEWDIINSPAFQRLRDIKQLAMYDAHNLLVSLDGKTRYLDNVSEIVGGMSSRIWRGRVNANLQSRGEVDNFCDSWLQEHPSKAATGGPE